MIQFFFWYITITILGLLTFPLAYRILPTLSDRGYAFSRSLGLLLWSFIFWLAVSLGLSQNNLGGLFLALAVLVGLAIWANWWVDRLPQHHRGGPLAQASSEGTGDDQQNALQSSTFNFQPILQWFKPNLRYVISVEILFFMAFAFLAFVRANNPELVGTEKPMEMAFINAIIHSPTFPPHDPWLSGYGISYYYFGYVMTAMLAKITSTVGSVAFNLMISLVFGLSAIGAYGLLYNLLNAYWAWRSPQPSPLSPESRARSIAGAFLAPIFLIVIGNWEALLEMLHKYGVGWTGKPGDVNLWTNLGVGYPPPEGMTGPYNFWTWLNILELKDPPGSVNGGIFERLAAWWSEAGIQGLGGWFTEVFTPGRGGWWWWRASRVVTDYDLRGNHVEIIDEFPAFSYLLGDLHPHVLALPFGLLLGALALNLYMGGWKGETRLFKLKFSEQYELDLKFPVRLDGFILLAVALGGMAFLNTWAFPIYLGLVCVALVLRLVHEQGWNWELFEEFLKFSIPLAILSVVLYLPFYLGFSSQAGGILPNVVFPTRGAHLWVMFGGLFVPIFAFLFWLRRKEVANWRTGFSLVVGLVLFLWAFSTVLGLIAANTDVGAQFVAAQGSSTWDVLREANMRRLQFGGGLLSMALLIGGAVAYLAAIKPRDVASEARPGPLPFVWMLILLGGLLVLAPDFVYLRDQFGNRMNTIFKFYYEAWALWSIAATFGAVVMIAELGKAASKVYTGVIFALVAIGLIYPVVGITNKTNNFQSGDPTMRTLDGAAHLQRYVPDEYQAFLFLERSAPGVVAEAVGGQYSDYGRVSIYSGHPTVLGWPGHESQWRGGDNEIGSRESEIKTLYTTSDWAQTQEILDKYDIRYVYIGPQERQTYNVDEEKFAQHLSKIYSQGAVAIYLVP